MSETKLAVDAMAAVTVSRQYGSGGGEIARRLAERLGWQLIDHEIVVMVASKLGITTAEAEERDEYAESFVFRALRSIGLAATGEIPTVPPLPIEDPEETYRSALASIVTTAVEQRHVVIVGRAGQVLLANRRDVLHVRIVAPLELRVAYVAQREGLSEAAARSRVQLKDRDRQHFIQSFYHRDPNDPMLYDLIVNTGVLDLGGVVDLLELALARKAARLAVPEKLLGPGAGLAPYPGQLTDLRPPEGSGQRNR